MDQNLGCDVGSQELLQNDFVARINEIHHEINLLELENSVYLSFFTRKSNEMGANINDDKKSHVRNRRKQMTPTMLTTAKKIEVFEEEKKAIERALSDSKKSSERLIDTLQAIIQETDIHTAELKKNAYEFKKNVVTVIEDSCDIKTIAEKMLKYYNERIRQCDVTIEILKLKNGTLQCKIRKVEELLKIKADLGDTPNYIDFHQLQIENKQHESLVEEKHDNLKKLKATTGRTLKRLNSLKTALYQAEEEKIKLNNTIESRESLLIKISKDLKLKKEEYLQEQRLSKSLVNVTDTADDPPDIDAYMAQKELYSELQMQIKNMERKVDLAKMKYKNARKMKAPKK